MTGTTEKQPPHERLRALVREEISLLGQVDALSQRQAALIGQDDAEPLLALLAERQGIMERVAALAEEAATAREACEGGRRIPAAEWREIERSMAAVAELAERIATRDRADVGTLTLARDGIATEMTQVDKGRGAAAAYARPAARGPKYQDRQG